MFNRSPKVAPYMYSIIQCVLQHCSMLILLTSLHRDCNGLNFFVPKCFGVKLLEFSPGTWNNFQNILTL